MTKVLGVTRDKKGVINNVVTVDDWDTFRIHYKEDESKYFHTIFACNLQYLPIITDILNNNYNSNFSLDELRNIGGLDSAKFTKD